MRRGGFLPLVVLAAPVNAATLRVPADHPSIQEAIDAGLAGDVILVSDGEYGITQPLSFRGKDLILRSGNGPARTIILMTEAPARPVRHSVIVFETNETAAAVLEGFTITGGKGTRTPPDETLRGGGILCINGASPTIVGCRIEGNEAIDDPQRSAGGGFAAAYGSSPVLRDCEITRNRACRGGGVMAGGGALSLERCTISANTAVREYECFAGGILIGVGSDAVLTECLVIGNFGQYGGGGLEVLRARARISRCTFIGNSVEGNGGALRSTISDGLIVENTVFAANKATGSGGAVYLQDSAPAAFVNCTFTENLAGFDEPAVSCRQIDAPRLKNCLFWLNRGAGLCGEVESSLADRDPRFVNPGVFDLERTVDAPYFGAFYTLPDFVIEEPDLRIRNGSPALDRGSSEGAPEVDRDGMSRPCGGGNDVGAYELCLTPPRFRRGDVNADGVLDISDGLCVLDYLFTGSATLDCLESADANNDGSIDCSDPVLILGYLFLGSDPPPAPGPPPLPCGEDLDPTGSRGDLGCSSYSC